MTHYECPGCYKRLRLSEDVLGKLIRCPACGQTFRPNAQAGENAAAYGLEPASAQDSAKPQRTKHETSAVDKQENHANEAEAKGGRKKSGRGSRKIRSWRRVARGVKLIFFALATWVGIVLALFLLTLGAEGMMQPGLVVLMFGLIVLVSLAAGIVTLVGYCFCLFSPREQGARTLALISLMLVVLSSGLSGLLYVLNRDDPPRILSVLPSMLGFVQWVVFLFFLRALGKLLEANWLLRDISKLLYVKLFGQGSCFVLLMIILVVAGQTQERLRPLWVLLIFPLGIALIILEIVTFFRYLGILRNVGGLIDERIYKGQV